MAIILRGKTRCSICGAVIEEGDDIIATTHFISESSDPLWRFSDSAMHKFCFLKWEHRQEFVTKFNEIRGATTWGNGTYHHMGDDGNITVLMRVA